MYVDVVEGKRTSRVRWMFSTPYGYDSTVTLPISSEADLNLCPFDIIFW